MLFIGIGLFIFLILAGYAAVNIIKTPKGVPERVFAPVAMTFFGGAIIFLAAIIAILFAGSFIDGEDRTIFEFEIVAAGDNSLNEGSFFLFGGSIDEEPVYMYYRQYSDGAIKQGHLYTSNTSIYEDTEGEGRVDVVETDCTDWGWLTVARCDGERYEVHVPEDSVVKQFNFDLEN